MLVTSRRGWLVAVAALAACAVAASPGSSTAAAPADSTAARPDSAAARACPAATRPDSAAARRDSTAARHAAAARADSAAARAMASPGIGAPPAAGRADSTSRRGDIDADRLRYDGRTTTKRQFETRWPLRALDLPLASDALARPITLDAGLGLAGWRAPASDETPVTGFPLAFGPANAGTAVDGPGFAANDPFLVTTWRTSVPRPPMAGAGELLTRPHPVLWWEPSLRRLDGGPGVTTSALLYEKGAFGDEQAGARFAAPAFGRGIAAAYVQRASDGEGAYLHATEKRYSVAAVLPRVAGVSGWIDGDLAWRRIDAVSLAFPDTVSAAGEARHDERRLGLHLDRPGGVWDHSLVAEIGRSGHTTIDADLSRERWNETTWRLAAATTWRPAAGWTWLADARATGRGFQSRLGPAMNAVGPIYDQFAETRNEGRASLGVRRESEGGGAASARRSWSADLAYDGRAGDRGFLDARLGAAVVSPRAMAALDLESTHERATWEDRLSPSRDRYFEDVLVLPKPVRYSIVADRDLTPRRLNGGVARGEWRPGARVTIAATGSARYVADDFGWDLSRTETADSIVVSEHATWRGSGWVSHASLGASAEWRSVHVRALGWARGGSSRLSPRAGSPPRAGADASIDGGATFFQGDLPLRLGLDAHVLGKREGAIRAPAVAVFDASLRADFTEAGLFLRIDDVFDRRPPSGAYEISTDAGVPMPGRRFRFGVVWHLSD